MSTCEYALCQRPAELQVVLPAGGGQDDLTSLLLCGLHVSPVLTWGEPAPIEPVAIRHLGPRAA